MTFKLTRDRTFAIKLRARPLPGEVLDPADLELASCEADLKRAVNSEPPPPETEADATFQVDFDPDLPGWVLSLTDEVTDNLAPGLYVTDARVQFANGHVPPTGHVRVIVGREVTAR